MNNVLFDAEKGTITGLVDFDFASISHPCQEFFSSFQDVGGNTSGGRGPFASDERFVTSLLSGSYDIDGIPSELEDAWSVAKTWDKALSDKNVLKPSQISGIATLAQVGKLEGLLCPLRLVHPVFLKKMTDEDKTHARAKAEGELVRCLESLGF